MTDTSDRAIVYDVANAVHGQWSSEVEIAEWRLTVTDVGEVVELAVLLEAVSQRY